MVEHMYDILTTCALTKFIDKFTLQSREREVGVGHAVNFPLCTDAMARNILVTMVFSFLPGRRGYTNVCQLILLSVNLNLKVS